MTEVDDEVKRLIEAVKSSNTYKVYDKQKKLLKKNPELKAAVDQYRKENFELQSSISVADENAERRMEEFAEKYADFLEDSRVSDFLDAENNLCRMMQELTDRVVDSLDFE